MEHYKTEQKADCPKLRGTMSDIHFPAWIEVKRDGEFNVALVSRSEMTTKNKYGLVRIMPFMPFDYGCGTAIFMGELCYGEGHKNDIYKLNANKFSDEDIKFYPFDILELNGRDTVDEDLLTRLEIMGSIGINATGKIVESEEDIQNYYDNAIQKGYEGVVIKNVDERLITKGRCCWYKKKYKDRTNFEVVMVDTSRDRIEIDVRGNNVGVKATQQQKQNLKAGDIVTIKHQGFTKHAIRHPVFIKKGGE